MSQVLVIDFGSQYAQLIVRRVRELGYSCELKSWRAPLRELCAARAIVFSGGPASVYQDGAPRIDRGVFDFGIPILGICYGQQLMAHLLGGTVAKARKGEYGPARLKVVKRNELCAGVSRSTQAWMSHGDAVVKLPPGFSIFGKTANSPHAIIGNKARKLWGIQFHPEVEHTVEGKKVFKNFLDSVAGLPKDWSLGKVIETAVREVRDRVGKKYAIVALSGGVDSSVAAALVHEAIGKRLEAIFVDHGLLRQGESEAVGEIMRKALKVNVQRVEASHLFFKRLMRIAEPEKKRMIIGRAFIDVFQRAARRFRHRPQFLVQGTLYPDVIESAQAESGTTAHKIKSHHNVGGLPEKMHLQLVEPLRLLFKDEVRKVGTLLGLPSSIVERQPFPGPGLAVRIIGEVTRERVTLLQQADAIVREELDPLARRLKLWQYYAALLADVRSVGVQGDERTYAHPIVVRAVTSQDAMTADWARIPDSVLAKISTRITNEVRGVNRVLYDLTSKPPGTIEWE